MEIFKKLLLERVIPAIKNAGAEDKLQLESNKENSLIKMLLQQVAKKPTFILTATGLYHFFDTTTDELTPNSTVQNLMDVCKNESDGFMYQLSSDPENPPLLNKIVYQYPENARRSPTSAGIPNTGDIRSITDLKEYKGGGSQNELGKSSATAVWQFYRYAIIASDKLRNLTPQELLAEENKGYFQANTDTAQYLKYFNYFRMITNRAVAKKDKGLTKVAINQEVDAYVPKQYQDEILAYWVCWRCVVIDKPADLPKNNKA